MSSQHLVAVILGSNIDREHNLPAAVRLLSEATNVIGVSTVYETIAVGSHQQPNYFNAVVLLETELTPAELKDGLLTMVEQQLGRRRTADKYAPRTIDLDIVLYGDMDSDYIVVGDYIPADGRPHHIPDPDLLRYLHSAVPVAELLPELKHPETGESLHSIAARLLAKASAGGEEPIRPRPDIDLQQALDQASGR